MSKELNTGRKVTFCIYGRIWENGIGLTLHEEIWGTVGHCATAGDMEYQWGCILLICTKASKDTGLLNG